MPPASATIGSDAYQWAPSSPDANVSAVCLRTLLDASQNQASESRRYSARRTLATIGNSPKNAATANTSGITPIITWTENAQWNIDVVQRLPCRLPEDSNPLQMNWFLIGTIMYPETSPITTKAVDPATTPMTTRRPARMKSVVIPSKIPPSLSARRLALATDPSQKSAKALA